MKKIFVNLQLRTGDIIYLWPAYKTTTPGLCVCRIPSFQPSLQQMATPGDGWQLVHTPSGICLPHTWGLRREVVAAASRMADILDWEQPAKEISRIINTTPLIKQLISQAAS
uniref:Uncharacterized protein n=1 Tax=viral metagenome TaxID=1070528 RepID=A0A6M3LFM3_9ZZZZ